MIKKVIRGQHEKCWNCILIEVGKVKGYFDHICEPFTMLDGVGSVNVGDLGVRDDVQHIFSESMIVTRFQF